MEVGGVNGEPEEFEQSEAGMMRYLSLLLLPHVSVLLCLFMLSRIVE